ncbi:hypothetical protein Dimus_004671 [Dionaea muscipula]
MESLRLPLLPTCSISSSNFDRRMFLGSAYTQNPPDPLYLRRIQYDKIKIPKRRVTSMQAVQEDDELRQVKDMAAARKRWEALVREGKVKTLTPREAGYAIQLSGKTLIDVRPATERRKAWVKGSTWIPIFDVDTKFDIGSLSRRATNFMMGGWWSGVPTLSYNKYFMHLPFVLFLVSNLFLVYTDRVIGISFVSL